MTEKTHTVDFDKFRQETGLEEETVIELYQGFLEELLEEKEKLLVQLRNRELDKLERTVHNIKGISSSYMTGNVFQQALALDTLLKKGESDNVKELVNRLTNDIIDAAGDIVRYCGL